MTLTALPGELTLRAERDALVDALIATQDRLAAVAALLKASSDTLDLDELTHRMLAEALELTGSDVAVLSCAHGRPHQRASRESGVRSHRLNLVLDGCLQEMRLGSGTTDGLPWALTGFPSHPSVGIAIGRLRGPAYTTGDVRMLDTVAVAVEQLSQLSRLHQELVRQTAVEKEHQLASRLAQAVLPATQPSPPGVGFFARCVPAALTGGDFMAFAEVDDVLWIAVGDVAGKGLPAAMIMTQAVAAVRVAMRTGDPDDPAAAVAAVSRDLQGYLDSVESFLTLAVAVHRRGSGTVTLSNAGHSPVVYCPGPDEPPRSIGPSAPPVGVDVGRPPRTETLALRPGSRLVIGTDGLVEQPDPAGDLLGYDAFVDACRADASSAAELGERLMAQVERHANGTPAADDRTLVVLQGLADADG